jgi:hypothetical protein
MFIRASVFKLAFLGTVVIATGDWIWLPYVGLKRLIKLWPVHATAFPIFRAGVGRASINRKAYNKLRLPLDRSKVA